MKRPPIRRRRRAPRTYRLDEYSLREAILHRLDELGATRTDLADRSGVTAHRSTVFRFLSGAHEGTGHLDEILHAVGLALVAVDDRPAWLGKG